MFSAPHPVPLPHPRENQSYITHSPHVFHFIVSALMRGDGGQLHMTVRWTKVCVLIHPKPKQHVDSERPKTHREMSVPTCLDPRLGKKTTKSNKEKKKTLTGCWSRRGTFNSYWSCWIFHSRHSFPPNGGTNEEQLKIKAVRLATGTSRNRGGFCRCQNPRVLPDGCLCTSRPSRPVFTGQISRSGIWNYFLGWFCPDTIALLINKTSEWYFWALCRSAPNCLCIFYICKSRLKEFFFFL